MAFMYHLTVTQLRGYQKRLQDQNEAEAKLAHDTIMKETVIDKKKSETEWVGLLPSLPGTFVADPYRTAFRLTRRDF